MILDRLSSCYWLWSPTVVDLLDFPVIDIQIQFVPHIPQGVRNDLGLGLLESPLHFPHFGDWDLFGLIEIYCFL